ncbi:hypothetical protein N9Y29_00760 [Crocinitomicaceae bacterium]|nr:hypothetical protein [Crocinitomicaceae bacterium]
MHRWTIGLLLSFLIGCGMPMGNRVDSKNLKVYYLEDVSQQKAIAFATYWRDHGFVGEKEQVVQLSRNEARVLEVKLIEDDIYHSEVLEVQEIALLQQLARELKEAVFEEEVIIVITDNTLRPIERSNDVLE